MSENERRVADLNIHPHNSRIYGEPDDGLKDSLEQFGLQHAIHITPDGEILSGARRWTAAKALGWDAIRAEVVDLPDDVSIRKYVLLANAYRKAKPTWMQKLEADEYLALYHEGHYTKDDLKNTAEQKGVVTGGHDDRNVDTPIHLSARAAGLHPRTYQRFRYVTEPDGAEEEIAQAEKSGDVSPDQAEAIREELQDVRERVKRDEAPARTADNALRKRLREAKADNTYSEEERRQRDANNAAITANKKGKTFLNALEHLKADGHTEHLDERHALVLVNTVSEIVDSIREMQTHEQVEDGGREVRAVS